MAGITPETVTVGELDPIFVSVKDAAKALGVSTFTVYDLCDRQKIESRYQGRRRLVLVSSLRRYAEGLPTEPTEESA